MMTVPSHQIAIGEADIQAILQRIRSALESGVLTSGPQVAEFEAALCALTKRQATVAVANGTAAIEVVLRALGIGRGHEVLVQSNSFIATAAAVTAVGGSVRLADMDPDHLGPSPEQVARALTPDTSAVIVTHLGGLISGHLDAVRELCRERGLWLIEDSAQALGSGYCGQVAGAWGIAATCSFYARKVLTTGEGGAVVTDDPELAGRVRLLSDQGRSPDGVHRSAGTNARMTELQAAVGMVQLDRLEENVKRRRAIAARYDMVLGAYRRPLPAGMVPNFYKYWAELPTRRHRDDFRTAMAARRVELPGLLSGHEDPIHLQPAFADCGRLTPLPETERFAATHACLPLYPGLSDSQVEQVAAAARDALREIGLGQA